MASDSKRIDVSELFSSDENFVSQNLRWRKLLEKYSAKETNSDDLGLPMEDAFKKYRSTEDDEDNSSASDVEEDNVELDSDSSYDLKDAKKQLASVLEHKNAEWKKTGMDKIVKDVHFKLSTDFVERWLTQNFPGSRKQLDRERVSHVTECNGDEKMSLTCKSNLSIVDNDESRLLTSRNSSNYEFAHKDKRKIVSYHIEETTTLTTMSMIRPTAEIFRDLPTLHGHTFPSMSDFWKIPRLPVSLPKAITLGAPKQDVSRMKNGKYLDEEIKPCSNVTSKKSVEQKPLQSDTKNYLKYENRKAVDECGINTKRESTKRESTKRESTKRNQTKLSARKVKPRKNKVLSSCSLSDSDDKTAVSTTSQRKKTYTKNVHSSTIEKKACNGSVKQGTKSKIQSVSSENDENESPEEQANQTNRCTETPKSTKTSVNTEMLEQTSLQTATIVLSSSSEESTEETTRSRGKQPSASVSGCAGAPSVKPTPLRSAQYTMPETYQELLCEDGRCGYNIQGIVVYRPKTIERQAQKIQVTKKDLDLSGITSLSKRKKFDTFKHIIHPNSTLVYYMSESEEETKKGALSDDDDDPIFSYCPKLLVYEFING